MKMAAAFSKPAKVVLVTGSSRGLGFAIARQFSRAGYAVILNGRDLRRLKETQRQMPGHAAILLADVADASFGRRLVGLARELRLSHIDVVIHNAGINHIGNLAETRIANAERTFKTNTLSIIHVVQAVTPWLAAASAPQFVLVSSLMQYFAMPGRSVYAASKAAAELLVRAWAAELKAQKIPIAVKILRPAGIETEFHYNTPTDGSAPRSTISRMPPERVAQYVMKLVKSRRSELAPGFTNKLVAFVARHFPRWASYLAYRKYIRDR